MMFINRSNYDTLKLNISSFLSTQTNPALKCKNLNKIVIDPFMDIFSDQKLILFPSHQKNFTYIILDKFAKMNIAFEEINKHSSFYS